MHAVAFLLGEGVPQIPYIVQEEVRPSVKGKAVAEALVSQKTGNTGIKPGGQCERYCELGDDIEWVATTMTDSMLQFGVGVSKLVQE